MRVKIPQWLAWPCVVITVLLAAAIIVLIILNPVPTFGGGYSCETRLSIAYKGMTAATAEVDRKGMAAFALTRSMTDAFGSLRVAGEELRVPERTVEIPTKLLLGLVAVLLSALVSMGVYIWNDHVNDYKMMKRVVDVLAGGNPYKGAE